MPDKVVQVDGVGNVAFPDSMKDEDIASVIKQQHPNLKAPSGVSKTISNILPSAGNAIASTAAAYRGGGMNQPDALPPMVQGEDPNAPFYGLRQTVKAIAGVANKIRHPLQTFQEDPVGTIASAGQAVSGLRGGIGNPSISEDAIMSHVPQTFNPAPHIGEAARAAAPDVAAGASKAAMGVGLAEAAPGPLKWPARTMLAYPGVRQIGRGLKAGTQAARGGTAEEALAEMPTIAPPTAVKPPAIFGDPEGFSKLPQNVQDAITRGQQSAAPTPKPVLAPRGLEHYGITPKPETVTVHEPPDLRIASPAQATPGAIPVPEPTVKGAITKLNTPEHEPYNSFSPSRVERQMTPAETTLERGEYEARVERLRKAFPLETDQQLRARADTAIKNKKLNANGGMDVARQLKQSLEGQ